jgi:hypothetical protein
VTLWHYQWLLVNEHLPQIAGQHVVNDVLAHGNRFYRPPPGDAFMPIEFGAACYRFGHLLRQLTWSLPSGQAVAQAMGVPRLTAADLSDIGSVYAPFTTSTPLWYYILAEAKVAADGLTLGPVAARIVTETLIGLLRADPTSYLSIYPRFRPFLGSDLTLGPNPDTHITGNRSYTRAHFLYYAGVVQPGTYR